MSSEQQSHSRRSVLQLLGLAAASGTLLPAVVSSPARAEPTWSWPLRVQGRQTGWYSTQASWYTANPPWHHALDVVSDGGDPTVCAIASGWVDFVDVAQSGFWYGNHVRIAHGEGYFSSYSHLHSAPALAVGDAIGRSSPIGMIGNTGSPSTGSHLHLEVLQGGITRYAGADCRIDPLSKLAGAPLAGQPQLPPTSEPAPIQIDGEPEMLVVKNTATGHVFTVGQQYIRHETSSTGLGVAANLYNSKLTTWRRNTENNVFDLPEWMFNALLSSLSIPPSKATAVLGGGTWSKEHDILAAVQAIQSN